MAFRLAPRSAAIARALVPRASAPVRSFKKFSMQDRSFQTCKPAFAKGCCIFNKLIFTFSLNSMGAQSTLAWVSKPIRLAEFGLIKKHIWLKFLSLLFCCRFHSIEDDAALQTCKRIYAWALARFIVHNIIFFQMIDIDCFSISMTEMNCSSLNSSATAVVPREASVF
jgi:hypothetical protein